MRPETRRQAILALADDRREVSVDEIAHRFGISRETARRDLGQLNADGRLRRVHGGALKTAAEPAIAQRMRHNAGAKATIARAAARLFEPGDTLMIDAGSTTSFFASALAERPAMTLITTSLDVAQRASLDGARHRILLLGGEFRADLGEVAGSATLEQIGMFSADHAVLTVGAVDAERGIMDFDMEEAMIARAMLRRARTVTVLADRTKLGRVALVQVCELGAIGRLVTEAPPEAAMAEALRRAGVNIIIAEVNRS